MCVGRFLLLFVTLCAVAAPIRAEYMVLRSGQRIAVTGYERVGDSYRLHVAGGVVQVAVTDVVAIEPEEVFTAIAQPPAEKPPYQELIHSAAQRCGLDADLIASVIAVESNFDPRAVSKRNARGLMQLLPETAQRLGAKDVFDPRENIEAGTRYLKELLQKYNNNLALALAAYNAGPDKVQQYGAIPPYAETRSYVRRVTRVYDQRKTQQTSKPQTPINSMQSKRIKPAASL